MDIKSLALLSVVITICLTFYIVACAKNTNPITNEPQPNFLLLLSILFMSFSVVISAVANKLPNSPGKDWAWFIAGMFLFTTGFFPVVLYMTSTISMLALILSSLGNFSLIVAFVGLSWIQSRSGGGY